MEPLSPKSLSQETVHREMTKAQLRMAQAAMANRDTSVSELCRELKIRPVTLYRYVDPEGNLRENGKRLLGV